MTKQTKWPVHPAKTQISLSICPVWSETLLSTQWVAKDPRFLHVDSKDSDQTSGCPGWSESLLSAQIICWVLCCALAPLLPGRTWESLHVLDGPVQQNVSGTWPPTPAVSCLDLLSYSSWTNAAASHGGYCEPENTGVFLILHERMQLGHTADIVSLKIQGSFLFFMNECN